MSEGSGWLARALTRSEEDVSSEPRTEAHRTLRAKALDWLATFNIFQGDLDSAQARFEESLALFRELEDTGWIAEVLGDFGMFFQMRGDYARASDCLEESLALRRELGHIGAIAWSLNFLGTLAYTQGHIGRAGDLWEESLALFREPGDTLGIASVLPHLAMAALDQGDYGWASVHLVESLTRLREMGERLQIVHTLEVFACLAAVQGQRSEDTQPRLLRAARIFGAAAALRETLHTPVLPFLRDSYERGVTTLRAQLDEATFNAYWAEGRAMTLEQAVAYALSEN